MSSNLWKIDPKVEILRPSLLYKPAVMSLSTTAYSLGEREVLAIAKIRQLRF